MSAFGGWRTAHDGSQVALTVLTLALSTLLIAAQDPAEKGEDKGAPAAEKKSDESAAPAQDTAAPEQQNMLVWIYKAEGIFFFPQLAISIVVVTMIVFYSLQTRTGNFLPPEFLQQFDTLFKEKKFPEAYELARKEESFVGKMVAAAISKLSLGYPQSVEAAQEVADDEGMKHEHRLSYLAMMANLATMVGLLGTVWGMVGSFMVISRSDTAPRPSELAAGVSTALVTTVAGLMQAIPATLAFTILKNRAARLGFEASMACEQIISRFVTPPKRTPTPAGTAGPAPSTG